MLMVAVAMLSLYLVARRWISIRERGKSDVMCRLDQSLQSENEIHLAGAVDTRYLQRYCLLSVYYQDHWSLSSRCSHQATPLRLRKCIERTAQRGG